MDRMSMLETSSHQWKVRVPQSDATQFTVAHKIGSSSTSSVPSVLNASNGKLSEPQKSSPPSPALERVKKSPQAKIFKSKTGGNLPEILGRTPSIGKKDFRRCLSQPGDPDNSKGELDSGSVVSIPKADDETFDAFFTKTLDLNTSEPSPSMHMDFDLIANNSTQLVVQRRNVRVARRQQTTKNPLKALAAREDIKMEYTEVKLGAGEKELKRMKVEELSKGSTMAVEALAGLASKENFSAISLKKVEENPLVREMPPYNHPMLLQVKGRRHAQTRVVETSVSSVNLGDDFLLITPATVYHFKGDYANVIERAKASEIAAYIVQTKDMGVNADSKVVEVTSNSTISNREKFWSILGGTASSQAQSTGPSNEDEHVEAALTASNKVYQVQSDALVPVQEAWGQIPKYSLLTSDKVLVFDFGSEVYLWAGKRACGEERQVGVILARELWKESYDYTDCDINPIYPMQTIGSTQASGTRPDWTICGKLTENVETILFKEKFIDWPDTAQQTRIKEVRMELEKQVAPVCELQPCDARQMFERRPSEPDIVLEMSHLGRGLQYYDEEERRQLTITTNDSKVWHVLDSGKQLIEDKSSHGQFHAGDSYVVRWYYHISLSGRTLKGSPSKHAVTGRDRVAYFFWQGTKSSISDKGIAALMTVELDEERGPHIRVPMGAEPPAFLNLFDGGLVIHQGHRGQVEDVHWKLFSVRGEMENEGHLVQVELDAAHLRSRGCFVLINTVTAGIHLWHGAKALRHTRKVATATAQKLIKNNPSEFGWKSGTTSKIKEQFEGAETREFWEGLGGNKMKCRYHSLLDAEESYDWTPRVWRLEATHDSFQASEISPTYRAPEIPNPLPLTQQDLYNSPQPGLFIIDGGHDVWVWQGWWPNEDEYAEDANSATTGSALLRFTFARRACLQTALNYCQYKAKAQAKIRAESLKKKAEDVETDAISPMLVLAGLEPLQFTNVFHNWTHRPDVTAIQEKECRWHKDGQYPVEEVLLQLSRTQYSLTELQERPLPDGVDPLRLEVYLDHQDFEHGLGMDRESFYSLQNWKQIDIKKNAKLF